MSGEDVGPGHNTRIPNTNTSHSDRYWLVKLGHHQKKMDVGGMITIDLSILS